MSMMTDLKTSLDEDKPVHMRIKGIFGMFSSAVPYWIVKVREQGYWRIYGLNRAEHGVKDASYEIHHFIDQGGYFIVRSVDHEKRKKLMEKYFDNCVMEDLL